MSRLIYMISGVGAFGAFVGAYLGERSPIHRPAEAGAVAIHDLSSSLAVLPQVEPGALITAIVIFYFVPSALAMLRGHHNAAAIFILNLMLGWTFLGWVASLVWAATAIRRAEPTMQRV